MPASIYVRRLPKILTGILYPLRIFINYNFFLKSIYRIYNRYPYKDSIYTGYVWSAWDVERLTFPSVWFDEGTCLPFEDTVIQCPADYGKYLSAQFGNYMELPPESERVQVHKGTIDLENSYMKYVNNEINLQAGGSDE